MQSVRITREAAPRPAAFTPVAAQRSYADITWRHPAGRGPLVQPDPTPHSGLSPHPRQGSPTRNPRPPTEHRRPQWSANTR